MLRNFGSLLTQSVSKIERGTISLDIIMKKIGYIGVLLWPEVVQTHVDNCISQFDNCKIISPSAHHDFSIYDRKCRYDRYVKVHNNKRENG